MLLGIAEDSKDSNAARNRLSNSMRWINMLPPEVLSHAFILAEGMTRGQRALGKPYPGTQDSIAGVCGFWRDIAINTPQLWTYIYISGPPPHLLARLYISRSGDCPLDLDLEMRMRYNKSIDYFDYESQEKRFIEMFEFILECGGTCNRWRSLIVVAKARQIIHKIARYLNTQATPILKFLSLRWKADTYTLKEEDEVGEPDDWNGPGDSHSLGRGPNRPQIRQAELYGLPSILVFNPRAPVVSDLISLTLVGSVIPSIQRISTMLSSNPQLESLHLGIDRLGRDLFDPCISLARLHVQLPHLRSLVLSVKAGFGWGLQLLQIIDVPGLEYFELRSSYLIYDFHSELDPQVLFWYIAVGRVHGALQICLPPEAKPLNSGSIFPSLCHLNIQQLHLTDQRRLLEAFPSITQVTLNEHALRTWVEHPSLLPNISLITYAGQTNKTLRTAMSSITFQGAGAGTTPLFKEIILAKHFRMYAVIAPNRVLEDGVDCVINSLHKFADVVDLCKLPTEVYDSDRELIGVDGWLGDDDESSNGDGNEA